MKTLGEIQQAVPPLGEQIRAQRDSIGRVTIILREIGARLEV